MADCEEIETRSAQTQARVLKVLKLQRVRFGHKTFCWIEYTDDQLNDEQPSTGDPPEDTVVDPQINRDEILQTCREWAHVPCVATTGHTVGSTVTVSLVDGDPKRPIHLDYQRQAVQDSIMLTLWVVPWVVIPAVLLYFMFPGAPVALSSSNDIEESINTGWERFFDRLGLTDDDEDPSDEDSCSIPWFVCWAYNLVVFGCLALPCFFWVQISSRLKNRMEVPDNAYQLLTDQEDGEETEAIPALNPVV